MPDLIQHWPLFLSAFAAGFVDSIGGGGGLISIPAFLAAGVPYPLLLGTNKAMAGFGSIVAVTRYARAGLLPSLGMRTWAPLLVIACGAGAMGALISTLPFVLQNLRFLIPVLLFSVMAYLVRKWFWKGPAEALRGASRISDEVRFQDPLNRAGIGLIAGYDGLFGPGTGTFFLSFLERSGMETVRANAVTKVLNLGSNLGALVFFAVHSRILWPVGLACAVTFMAGNYTGAGLVLKKGQALVRVTVVAMTLLMFLKYASGL